MTVVRLIMFKCAYAIETDHKYPQVFHKDVRMPPWLILIIHSIHLLQRTDLAGPRRFLMF